MARNKSPTSTAPKHNLPPTLKVACVLQVNVNPFGGKGLGIPITIATSLLAMRSPDKESFLGFIIEFPLPTEVDSTGFGQCHHIDFATQRAIPSKTWKLTVKFPREEIDITYRATSEEENARYPTAKKHMAWVDVVLGKDASVSVEGFAMPYSNLGHPAEAWLRYPASATFLATQPERTMMARWSVASLVPNFDYGYGTDQSWDMDKYMKQFHDVKGHRFQTAWSFGADDSHVTAMTQSIVQDFMWIQKSCLDTDEVRLLNRHPLTEKDFVIRVIEPLQTQLDIRLDWKLHLSAAFWLLTCLGSESLPPLHKDDGDILHEFHVVLADSDIFTRLLERVSGKIPWEE
ncbi:DNA helicase [Fusarium agapanthi]|uniref:DNA helicase n=1 Tax=Fusarium agapanthi TaxID=1803897 RepID=A0A9P5EGV0_9HYPO|nr:DNA helicase [Fusarium agapanthi]